MSGPVNPIFYHFFVKSDAFRTDATCVGCGQCVKNCPLNNITLKDRKPVWGKQCTHCMACIFLSDRSVSGVLSLCTLSLS